MNTLWKRHMLSRSQRQRLIRHLFLLLACLVLAAFRFHLIARERLLEEQRQELMDLQAQQEALLQEKEYLQAILLLRSRQAMELMTENQQLEAENYTLNTLLQPPERS